MVINEYPETLAGGGNACPGRRTRTAHVVPLELRIGTGYDYLGDSLFYRFLFALLSPSRSVFSPFSIPFCSGSSSMGGKTSSVCGDGGAISICNHVHPLDCTMLGSAFSIIACISPPSSPTSKSR